MITTYTDLIDKTVLVTGATRGIGRSIALTLAKQQAHVVFNYRGDASSAQQLQTEIEAAGGKSTALKFDMTHTDEMFQAIDTFLKDVGPISGLVNNAGISKDQLLLRIKEADVSQTLDINLKAQILLTAHLTKNFLRAPDVSIVNISSVVGMMGNASQAVYAASKAGLIGFTKSVAKELAQRNIRCNAICPGLIESDMTEALTEKAKENYLVQIPLKRIGATDEVAELTCFLLSKASSYITGESIKIDGGLSMA